MATVYVTLGQVGARGQFGNHPIMAGPLQSETITSSGTTAVGAKVANKLDIAQIFCATTVAVVAGAAPTATLALGMVCPAGVPSWLAVQAGDKIAVIDA